MDVSSYSKLKALGHVTVQKLPIPSPQGDVVVTTKRFDPATGEPVSPAVEIINSAQLPEVKQSIETSLVSVTELIDDLTSL